MRSAYENLSKHALLIQELRGKLRSVLPELAVLSFPPKAEAARTFDLYAKDRSGKEYFVEVKARPVHRVDVGRIVEQAAGVFKARPNAAVLLICQSIDSAVSALLAKIGIRTIVFADLGLQTAAEAKQHKVPLRLSPTELQAYLALVRNERKVISTSDFAALMQMPGHRAKNVLARLSKRAVLFRLGRGTYGVLPPDILYAKRSYTVDPYTVIDRLLKGKPYYVAYSSAAHLHGIAAQLPLTAYVVTLEQRRSLDLGRGGIRFITNARPRFFGTQEREYAGSPLRVSDLEKTVLDCLDRPDLVGGVDEGARILAEALSQLNWGKLTAYAKRMERQVLMQRLGFVLEKLGGAGFSVPPAVTERLKRTVRHGFAYPLDPRHGRRGRLSQRWRIYENVDCLRWR